MNKVICVAEKNSIAKAVAGHLSGGRFTTVGRQISSLCAATLIAGPK